MVSIIPPIRQKKAKKVSSEEKPAVPVIDPANFDGREFVKQFGVDRPTMEKLVAYKDLLDKWQKSINLVGRGTIPEAWSRHFADSAQLAALLPEKPGEEKAQGILKIADLGCGAGFPGMVLAMMCPNAEVHLIESDERKCEFLRTVSRETNTDVHIHNERAEQCLAGINPDVITARALASLKDLLEYSLPCARNNPDLLMFFFKGEQAMGECKQAATRFDFHVSKYPSLTSAKACILRVSALGLPTIA